MKQRHRIILIIFLVLVVAATGVFVYFITFFQSSSLTLTVRDSVSKSWIWDLEIEVQNKIINAFFQSDQGVTELTFPDLKRGEWKVSIRAPYYESTEIPVDLKRGKNILPGIIELKGLEIPDVKKFYVFTGRQPDGYAFELRPVNSKGYAIANHPCLDIWIGLKVSEQLLEGRVADTPSDLGAERGMMLYGGDVKWQWDATPETQFRYSAFLPSGELKPSTAAYLVFDFIIIVPKNVDTDLLPEMKDGIREKIIDMPWEEVAEYLDSMGESLSWYIDSSWNIEG